MPKEDKYYRALSALNDDDRTFLYKLIPNLSEQTEDIQTKVEELAEIVINRTGLSLAKIIEYHNEVNIKQGYYEPNINQYSRYYQNGFFNNTYDDVLCSRLQYVLREKEQKEIEKEIKENYINKIERTKPNKHRKNILDKLSGQTTPYIFAKAIYQGINGLNAGNIYAVIENRAIIATLLGNVTNDEFCNFKDFGIVIKTALAYNQTAKKKKEKHQAHKYIGQISYATEHNLYEKPKLNSVKKDSRSIAYQALKEWQLLYNFFKPIKNKIIDTVNMHNEICNEQIDVSLSLDTWLDVVIYAVYGYQKQSKTEEQYIKKYNDLISAYKKLYMDNRKIFSSDFYSLNHFVASFNVVVLCLYENVWNKDIEPFFN